MENYLPSLERHLFRKQDANITKFMKKVNITTYKGLESYYIQKIVNMVDTIKYSSIVWEDVFTNGVKLPNETIVHVWRSGWTETMKNVILINI